MEQPAPSTKAILPPPGEATAWSNWFGKVISGLRGAPTVGQSSPVAHAAAQVSVLNELNTNDRASARLQNQP
jgi:hypothetical protein